MRCPRRGTCLQKEGQYTLMENIQELLQQIPRMQWSDYLDIILVAFLLYKLLPTIHAAGGIRVAKVIVTLLAAVWLTDVLNLYALNFLLNQVLAVGLIALVVLFQPELRRVIDHLGGIRLRSLLKVDQKGQELEPVILQTVLACEAMSRERVGALIVFSRENPLDEYYKTGTLIDGQVTEQLLRNIFFPKASLHDGAVIIQEGRVAAAGCVLPLSASDRISAELGTRHRAGIGMSEVSDAVVVIVSEETGAISVAVGGMLKRHLAPQTLERLLRNELIAPDGQREDSFALQLRRVLRGKEKKGEK